MLAVAVERNHALGALAQRMFERGAQTGCLAAIGAMRQECDRQTLQFGDSAVGGSVVDDYHAWAQREGLPRERADGALLVVRRDDQGQLGGGRRGRGPLGFGSGTGVAAPDHQD